MLILAGVAFVDQHLFTWRVVFCLCLHNKSASTLKWTPSWMSLCAPQLAPRTLQRKPLRCALTRRLLVQMHGHRWKHCFRGAGAAEIGCALARRLPVQMHGRHWKHCFRRAVMILSLHSWTMQYGFPCGMSVAFRCSFNFNFMSVSSSRAGHHNAISLLPHNNGVAPDIC